MDSNGLFTLFALVIGPLLCITMIVVFAWLPEKLRKSNDEVRAEVKRRIDELHR